MCVCVCVFHILTRIQAPTRDVECGSVEFYRYRDALRLNALKILCCGASGGRRRESFRVSPPPLQALPSHSRLLLILINPFYLNHDHHNTHFVVLTGGGWFNLVKEYIVSCVTLIRQIKYSQKPPGTTVRRVENRRGKKKACGHVMENALQTAPG